LPRDGTRTTCAATGAALHASRAVAVADDDAVALTAHRSQLLAYRAHAEIAHVEPGRIRAELCVLNPRFPQCHSLVWPSIACARSTAKAGK